ncbi:MAG: alpha-ketoglutarate-dependent dioxygenase AlkB [Chloroflexota bacterium]|nr:alpha-ketoglutarate-dependent dioxygenase AlkB [Chloroflexota bacterium]
MRKSVRSMEPPEGFRYQAEVVPAEEERELVEQFRQLPLKEFEFHGYVGKRRTLSFGWHYDFGEERLQQTEQIPAFLQKLRERAAGFAGLSAEALSHALVTEYSPGTTIGWHRDKGVFDDVVGISLLSPCTFRLRRKTATGWERYSLTIEPRSAYLLRGTARTQWEHSIPAVDALRYSVTFRSLRSSRQPVRGSKG